jgi:hypothetical protein
MDLVSIPRFAGRKKLVLSFIGQLQIGCDAFDDFFWGP